MRGRTEKFVQKYKKDPLSCRKWTSIYPESSRNNKTLFYASRLLNFPPIFRGENFTGNSKAAKTKNLQNLHLKI